MNLSSYRVCVFFSLLSPPPCSVLASSPPFAFFLLFFVELFPPFVPFVSPPLVSLFPLFTTDSGLRVNMVRVRRSVFFPRLIRGSDPRRVSWIYGDAHLTHQWKQNRPTFRFCPLSPPSPSLFPLLHLEEWFVLETFSLVSEVAPPPFSVSLTLSCLFFSFLGRFLRLSAPLMAVSHFPYIRRPFKLFFRATRLSVGAVLSSFFPHLCCLG